MSGQKWDGYACVGRPRTCTARAVGACQSAAQDQICASLVRTSSEHQGKANRMNETRIDRIKIPRRALLKIGALGTAAVAVGSASSIVVPELRRKGLDSVNGVFDATSIALASKIYDEVFPTSPLILNPFSDELNVPKALRPVPWSEYSNWKDAKGDAQPGPGLGQQNSYRNEQHQKW